MSRVRESFCESGEGRRGCQASQRQGLTSGVSGEPPGRSGKLPGNLWIAVKFHSERTSGQVAGELPGKSRELPGKSGTFQKLGVA